MKNIIFILLIAPIVLLGQDSIKDCPDKSGVVVTVSKDGIKTVKDVLTVTVCTDQVIFVVSKTAYQTFYKLNGGQWVDGATDKIVKIIEKDDTVYFIKSEKKLFAYYNF